VILHAEQGSRSFAWQLSPETAERMADELRKKGWTVTIRPDGQELDPAPPKDE
jgi:hypothetical protein